MTKRAIPIGLFGRWVLDVLDGGSLDSEEIRIQRVKAKLLIQREKAASFDRIRGELWAIRGKIGEG